MNKENNISNIDIVLPWVDGSDHEWRKNKAAYQANIQVDDQEERYRDWQLLKYVFRGIENNLSWVRKVHFITCGHLPEWLNTDYEKIHVVNHKDYIPEKYLPTFSSHPIELNIHRIEGLSDQFIYTNDDLYFLNSMPPETFFKNGIPCSQAGMNILNELDDVFNSILFENRKVINRNFYSRDVLKHNMWKFINLKYQFKDNFKSLILLPYCVGYFPALAYIHGPNAYLKSTFEAVWQKEEKVLDDTCTHKFRQFNDVNQYLFLWWQWCEGNFVPEGVQNKLRYIDTKKSINELIDAIEKTEEPMLCINDAVIDEYEEKKAAMIAAFERKFPIKSKFEI